MSQLNEKGEAFAVGKFSQCDTLFIFSNKARNQLQKLASCVILHINAARLFGPLRPLCDCSNKPLHALSLSGMFTFILGWGGGVIYKWTDGVCVFVSSVKL